MAYSTHETKQTIEDTITACGGEARLWDIGKALGPEWYRGGTKYPGLRKLVGHMTKQGVLKSPRRGVYSLPLRSPGFDKRDVYVRLIEEVLTEKWGRARRSEILDVLGLDNEASADRNHVTAALRHTPDKFGRDGGDGLVWTLNAEARRRLPLTCYWARYELDLWGDVVLDAYCAKIGAAFKAARGALRGLAGFATTVCDQPDVRKALLAITEKTKSNGFHSDALADLRVTVARELAAKGITASAVIAEACEDRKDDWLAWKYLDAFERGVRFVHFNAGQDIITALTRSYGVDPVAITWEGRVVSSCA